MAFLRVFSLVIGGLAVYFSYKLYVKAQFVFRGGEYSIEDSPVMFFLQVGGLCAAGLYLVYFAIVGDSSVESDK